MKKYLVSYQLEFLENQYPGKFIALEGIDGSGKTTQAHLVAERLNKIGKKVIFTKEPTDEETGQLVRKVLSGKVKIPPIALQYLFSADRTIHQEQIISLLKKGNIVFTDRYFWTGVAYAMADIRNASVDLYLSSFSVLSHYHRFIVPDIAFYLDVRPDEAFRRIKNSKKHNDIYDRKEKLNLIYKSYTDLINRFDDLFTIINGEQTEEKVTQEILSKIDVI